MAAWVLPVGFDRYRRFLSLSGSQPCGKGNAVLPWSDALLPAMAFLTGTYGAVITAPGPAYAGAAWVLLPGASHRSPVTINEIDWKKPVRTKSAHRDRTRGKKMFAVFKTGGKQYRVAAEDVLKVDKIKGEPGQIVEFGEVLVVGGDTVSVGVPKVEGATVAAEVLDQGRGRKVIAFKKRRRKNSRRKRGHRQEFTLLRITEILTDGKKASKTAPPRPKRAAKPKAEADTEAAGQPEAGSAKTSAKTSEKPKSRAKKPAAAAKKKK
jgi:large subunit ribosomal protein L21